MSPVVDVSHLVKSYVVPVREAGVRAALASLVRRRTRTVEAVRDISFQVTPGEIVGVLGPNGAGKTTALKMLTGLLHPTAGDARVLGYRPWRRQREFLRRITLVMGQRNQLVWDIPVIDSLERNRAIYGIERPVYRQRLDELVALLELGPLLDKPVRNLSLGERMKCEIAAALLHAPQVLFLDEPTIGLDVTMQRRLRAFVREYNARTGATVILTSHYMADVEALCRRVLVIHHGRLLFDGDLASLVGRFAAYKTIAVKANGAPFDPAPFGEVVSRDGDRIALRVTKEDAPRVTSALLSQLEVHDLTVEDPPIDEVIDRIFSAPPG
ncbi:MAG TPA: ATP-binding cassette domain-containing protein [Gammaproteobacteria bacterium]